MHFCFPTTLRSRTGSAAAEGCERGMAAIWSSNIAVIWGVPIDHVTSELEVATGHNIALPIWAISVRNDDNVRGKFSGMSFLEFPNGLDAYYCGLRNWRTETFRSEEFDPTKSDVQKVKASIVFLG